MSALIAATSFLFLSASLLWSNGMAYPLAPEISCTEESMVECTTDNICIHQNWLCDGESDCPDSSDEKECLNVTCPANYWRCVSGHCIPAAWRCDGAMDCPDGYDELECSFDCGDHEWRCEQSGNCISKDWVCDGKFDCLDYSDERICDSDSTTVSYCNPSTMWQCEGDRRSECIVKSMRCDGDIDCEGGSDEKGCHDYNSTSVTFAEGNTTVAVQQRPSCNSTHEFTCFNGRCISSNSTCDTIDDCGDESDEKDCESRVPCDPKTHWECPGIETTPPKCIEKTRRCDGVHNCADGADELNCLPQNCFPVSQWRCSGHPVQWIPLEFRCDGQRDCRDNSDESDCQMLASNQIVPFEI